MSSKITEATSADWQLSLASSDALVQGVNDISQCIEIILNTNPGSDPLRPTFGTRYLDHIDTPVNVAAPRMVNEIITAINTWEKRVTITNVSWRVVAEQIQYEISWTSKYGDGVNILAL